MRSDAFRIAAVAREECLICVCSAAVPVFGLAAHELPLPEPAREVHPWHEVVRYIGEEAGVIPVSDERFRDGGFIG